MGQGRRMGGSGGMSARRWNEIQVLADGRTRKLDPRRRPGWGQGKEKDCGRRRGGRGRRRGEREYMYMIYARLAKKDAALTIWESCTLTVLLLLLAAERELSLSVSPTRPRALC